MNQVNQRGEGETSKHRAQAVKEQNDVELEDMEQRLSAGSEASEEEAATSETEGTEEEPEEETEEQSEETVEGEEPETETTEDTTEETTEESEEPEDIRQLSARAQKRYQQLANENKQLKQEQERLINMTKTLQSQGYSKEEAQRIAPDIDTSGYNEITEDQYKEDIAKQARYLVKDELRKRDEVESFKKTQESFKTDLEDIEKKYPQLNPDKDSYDKDLDNFIGEYYDTMVKKDPTTRLKDVTDKVLNINRKVAEKETRNKADNIRKKASEQAIKSEENTDVGTDNIQDKIGEAETIEDLEKLEKELT